MRTIISLAVAIFFHLSLFYFVRPKNKITSTQSTITNSKYSTIDLTNFNGTSHLKNAAPGPRAHLIPPSPQEASSAEAGVSNNSAAGLNDTESIPTFVHFKQPEYPRLARLKGLEGKVKIKVFFDDQGFASKVEILESSTHPLLDEAVQKTALGWVSISKKNTAFEKSFEFKLTN